LFEILLIHCWHCTQADPPPRYRASCAGRPVCQPSRPLCAGRPVFPCAGRLIPPCGGRPVPPCPGSPVPPCAGRPVPSCADQPVPPCAGRPRAVPPCTGRSAHRAQAVPSPHAAAGDCDLEAPARPRNRAPTHELRRIPPRPRRWGGGDRKAPSRPHAHPRAEAEKLGRAGRASWVSGQG
jgi:hypothetical protein